MASGLIPWTKSEDQKLRDAQARGMRKGQACVAVAAATGRTAAACANRADALKLRFLRLKWGDPHRPGDGTETLARVCLYCGDGFQAYSRFERVCRECKQSDVYRMLTRVRDVQQLLSGHVQVSEG